MKLIKLNWKLLMVALIAGFGLQSCSDDDGSSNGGKANLTVRMTDAPGDYNAVLIDVQGMEIHVTSENELEGDDDGDGWIVVDDVQTGIYDLLELTGGVTQVLADTEVPEGFVSQIRLILGSNNTVMVDGISKPLNTPSAQQSGLKLQVNEDLEAGENYSFLLDFDVDNSIVTTGNGGYNLKPVIRLNAEANAGTVVGSIEPVNVQALVRIENSNITISAYTNADGEFSLNGVPAGTYKLTVIPDAGLMLNNYIIDEIEVNANSVTEVEVITL